jgi:hypothetical protein
MERVTIPIEVVIMPLGAYLREKKGVLPFDKNARAPFSIELGFKHTFSAISTAVAGDNTFHGENPTYAAYSDEQVGRLALLFVTRLKSCARYTLSTTFPGMEDSCIP